MTSERWRVEDMHEALWLVQRGYWGDAGVSEGGAEVLTASAAVARVSAWFPAGWVGDERLLADICLTLEGAFPASGVPDGDWLRGTVRRALEDGRLIALRMPFPAPVEAFIEEKEPPAPPREVRDSIRFVVVEDRTWKPIPGVKLNVTLPDGVEHLGTTGSDGSIEHSNIARSTCDLMSTIDGAVLANSFEVVALDHGEPPSPIDDEPIKGAKGRRFAITIQHHKVIRGDSLESVARSFGLTREQLTEFNFGTSKAKDVNRHLRIDVGCRERTRDRKNYVFDDADDPGLLYAPAPWARRSLPTDRTYTLRVRVPVIPKPGKKKFLFSV